MMIDTRKANAPRNSCERWLGLGPPRKVLCQSTIHRIIFNVNQVQPGNFTTRFTHGASGAGSIDLTSTWSGSRCGALLGTDART